MNGTDYAKYVLIPIVLVIFKCHDAATGVLLIP